LSRLASTLAVIWRLASPYFYSEDRLAGRLLLAAVITIELSLTGINVMLNQWQNRFYNALQDRNWDSFVTELMIFTALAFGYIILAIYQLYLQQWLQIRCRAWLTTRYVDHWLAGANHYQMQLRGDAADNPDQRIAEDIRLFVENGLTLGLRILGAFVSLCSFVVILWALSGDAPLRVFGYEVGIPGYLVWCALIYAIVGTTLTHLVGRKLIDLNFRQQRYEADFRFSLMRTRESSEQIALLRGEAAERQRLDERFGFIIANWHAIMTRTKRLTTLTASYSQAAAIIPYILVSPAYFAGQVQLGWLMQTAQAFDRVREAMSIFVDVYRSLAEWRAVVDRLASFDAAIAQARTAAASTTIVVTARESEDALTLDGLMVQLPQGAPLIAADDITVSSGERVLITGPNGCGKSTLLRAIAAIWPFGHGRVTLRKGARIMILPQRPYFPVATLATATTYPAAAGSFSHERLAEVIGAVGLPALVGRLDEEAHWNRMLSLGEQQRLGVARAILQAPDVLILDEATGALDEPGEAALYRLIGERLPGITIVSVGHRAALRASHGRQLTVAREGDHARLREREATPA
jgi:vitamin B12/bleomycin/antimicrobial peptide transport system ATP-binding/permease protein